MGINIKNNVYWVGKNDWELRKFHGDQMSTAHGSTYNSYLIKDEKNVLIDSVWQPFIKDFMSNLRAEIDPANLDYIIAQHAEPDHSGALPHIIAMKPDIPVFCTKMGVRSLKGHYHQDWNFQEVKTGDKLNIGSRELVFIEAPMLHWPDTLMTYLPGENILFSNDVFGQHFSSEFMYDDEVPAEALDYEALKYYVNIVSPFSKKVAPALKSIEDQGIEIDMIAPAHGMIWREKASQIIEKYAAYADNYSEDRITILYDTMYESTRRMAEAIADGIREASPATTVSLYNGSKYDGSDILTDIFRSKGVLVGSPTVNNGVLKSVTALLDEMINLGLGGKKAAAFTSYGWSPGSLKYMNEMLEKGGFELAAKGIKVNWAPDTGALDNCRKFGREFAESF